MNTFDNGLRITSLQDDESFASDFDISPILQETNPQ